jgi:hypothetical protein
MDTKLTTPDIAKLAGVRPTTVRQWRSRFGDFPAPEAVYAGTPVYNETAIRQWLRKHDREVAA